MIYMIGGGGGSLQLHKKRRQPHKLQNWYPLRESIHFLGLPMVPGFIYCPESSGEQNLPNINTSP